MADVAIQDAAFMADEDRWPRWPVLPLKRGGEGFPTLGVLVAGQGPTVLELSMFELVPEKIEKCTQHRYASFEQMVAAGWRVD
jgi:hypothetical protein